MICLTFWSRMLYKAKRMRSSETYDKGEGRVMPLRTVVEETEDSKHQESSWQSLLGLSPRWSWGRKNENDLADKEDDRQQAPVKGNWPMAKGELAGLCEVPCWKPLTLRLSGASGPKGKSFLPVEGAARKQHIRGRFWKSGPCLDGCPILSGGSWEEKVHNELSSG